MYLGKLNLVLYLYIKDNYAPTLAAIATKFLYDNK